MHKDLAQACSPPCYAALQKLLHTCRRCHLLTPASPHVAGCFTLFATHFGRLGQLASLYPNVRVWHLAVSTGAAGNRLTYMRRLQPGAAEDQHYGLLLAGAVGIPAEVRAARQGYSRPLSDTVADHASQSVMIVADAVAAGPGSSLVENHVNATVGTSSRTLTLLVDRCWTKQSEW